MTSNFFGLHTGRKELTRSWAGVVTLLCVLICPAAHGLTTVSRSFDELVRLADLVLTGTVKEVRSQFADDGLDRNTIFSYVTLTDLAVIKGQAVSPEYVLRVPGGVMGRFAQDYPGVPAFQTGQTYLVFIRGNQRDFFPVVGIGQGVYRILTNARGQRVVLREDRLGHGGQRALSAMTQNAPTLDEFIRSIRDRLTPEPLSGEGSTP